MKQKTAEKRNPSLP